MYRGDHYALIEPLAQVALAPPIKNISNFSFNKEKSTSGRRLPSDVLIYSCGACTQRTDIPAKLAARNEISGLDTVKAIPNQHTYDTGHGTAPSRTEKQRVKEAVSAPLS